MIFGSFALLVEGAIFRIVFQNRCQPDRLTIDIKTSVGRTSPAQKYFQKMEAVDECIPSDAGAAADEADLDIKSVVASGVKVADDGSVTAIPGSNLGMLFVAVLEHLLKRKDGRTKWVYKKTLGIRWNLLLSEVLILCWLFSFHFFRFSYWCCS